MAWMGAAALTPLPRTPAFGVDDSAGARCLATTASQTPPCTTDTGHPRHTLPPMTCSTSRATRCAWPEDYKHNKDGKINTPQHNAQSKNEKAAT